MTFVNGYFETGDFTGWVIETDSLGTGATASVQTTIKHSGSYAAFLVPHTLIGEEYNHSWVTIQSNPTTGATVGIWYYYQFAGTPSMQLQWSSTDSWHEISLGPSATWNLVSTTFPATGTYIKIKVKEDLASSDPEWYIDDVDPNYGIPTSLPITGVFDMVGLSHDLNMDALFDIEGLSHPISLTGLTSASHGVTSVFRCDMG